MMWLITVGNEVGGRIKALQSPLGCLLTPEVPADAELARGSGGGGLRAPCTVLPAGA